MRIAVIPARGGSRRIPRKNLRSFHGKPIIAYSIEAAKHAMIFDSIIVSTEDKEIGEVAEKYGAAVLWRPQELAVDEVGTQEVMKHAIQSFTGVEVACCIYPCAPMLSGDTLIAAHEQLRHWAGVDYVVPVGTWLRDPGQFYMGMAKAFVEGRPLIGPRTRMLQIPPETECDVNTEEDWARAEQMYAALHNMGDLSVPKMEMINARGNF